VQPVQDYQQGLLIGRCEAAHGGMIGDQAATGDFASAAEL
jgi:hypothetical protein